LFYYQPQKGSALPPRPKGPGFRASNWMKIIETSTSLQSEFKWQNQLFAEKLQLSDPSIGCKITKQFHVFIKNQMEKKIIKIRVTMFKQKRLTIIPRNGAKRVREEGKPEAIITLFPSNHQLFLSILEFIRKEPNPFRQRFSVIDINGLKNFFYK